MSESHEKKGEDESDGLNSTEKEVEAPTLLSSPSSDIDFPNKSSSSTLHQQNPEKTGNSDPNVLEMGSLSQGSPIGNSSKPLLSSSQRESPSRREMSSTRSPLHSSTMAQSRFPKKFMEEPFLEEENGAEENMIGNRSTGGRSGSAGTILPVSPGGFQTTKRASFHSAHGKKLPRRSSFLNEPASSPTQIFIRPPEPPPQPVVVQTRRCSLTLPYPNLYGSWQAANAFEFPHTVRSPTELTSVISHRHPPPLLKRRSLAQFDMSRMHAAQAETGGIARSKFHRRTLRGTSSQFSGGLTASPEAEEEEAPALAAEIKEISAKTEEIVEEEVEAEIIEEPYLLAIHLQKLPMKDFGSEVRATMDVAHFLNQAVLLLDMHENCLESVVDAMLAKLFKSVEEPQCTTEEVKCSLFAHDSVHLLSRTIQGTIGNEGVTFDYDQSWVCAICNLPSLQKRHVAIARLKQPCNFGRTSHEVRLFILVLCPSKQKGTKNALQTGITFATLVSEIKLQLLEAQTEDEFKRLILKQAQDLSQEQASLQNRILEAATQEAAEEYEYEPEKWCRFGNGIREDFERRFPHYLSDYRDGVVGYRTIQKTISTTFFLYFACILPAIAFGVLNHHTTGGIIDVKKVIVGQTLGELFYVIFSGQPLNILLTTAPLCLFVKIIYGLAEDFGIENNFEALYCCVGLWSSLFTAIYAVFDMSRLMRWSTRSTEEIFALFISIAFIVDAFRDTVKTFQVNYSSPACKVGRNITELVQPTPTPDPWFRDNMNTALTTIASIEPCQRDSSILFLLLMFGTLWLGVSLYNFNKTPYLQASKREALSDYSLPAAVLILSFVGSVLFKDVQMERFEYDDKEVFRLPAFDALTWKTVLSSAGLGFSLSLLIFMDQNITSAMVNNPCNKLKKGPAFHWDLLVVAIINGFLSLFTMPWMHATLPHSPLHLRSLADVEERVDQGHVYEIIVRVRETRLTGIFSHLLIGLSIFILPFLVNIPIAVLDGLFLYMAATALNGNQLFERITLLFMEQAAYPPNHYIRRVPQRKIHQFTICQLLQLMVMCFIGFVPWPYVKMVFPITLFLLLPIRHKIVPRFIEQRFLNALDGEHQ